MRPASGSSSRSSKSATVDFPLPLGPTIATISPARTENDTSSSTGPPRSNDTVTASNSISPRAAGSATAAADSSTSIGSSRICATRRSDPRTVARFVYMPINACIGDTTRI